MSGWTKLGLAVAALGAASLSACNHEEARTSAHGNEAGGNAAAAGADPASRVERGRYLATIMDCAGCHNAGAFGPNAEAGPLQGGTVGFEIPNLGVFYPPNLTPHQETGLGRWSEAEIVAAVRTGRRPDGRELAPAMPWRNYAALTDADAGALAAYLKSLPPVERRVPAPATPETAPQPYLTVHAPAAGGAAGGAASGGPGARTGG
jgi:cytochrome c553